jgi:hypothetical protein
MFVIISQIFAVLLAGIVISKSYVDFRARAESLQMFIFWLMTWMMIVLIALFPTIINTLIFSFGSGQAGLGTFFGMVIVFLYFVVYRIYVKLERMEQKLTKTIQELALKEYSISNRSEYK